MDLHSGAGSVNVPHWNDITKVYCLAMAGACFDQDLDYIEFFSGAAILAGAVRSKGCAVATYDKLNDCLWENLNTVEGLNLRLSKNCPFVEPSATRLIVSGIARRLLLQIR